MSNNWYNLGINHIWHPYTQMQIKEKFLKVKSTKGSYIYLEDETKLIDGISSWWTSCHGYNHEYIINKMKEQLDKFPHIMFADFAHENAYLLSHKLSKITPQGLNRVFFSDSGSTAVEVAMKLAIQYWQNVGQNNKNTFIAFNNSYHGDTIGAMSLSIGNTNIHNKFSNIVTQQHYLDIPVNDDNFDKFEKYIEKNKNNIAGLFIEPLIQCAKGMVFHQYSQLESIYKICKKHDILFIADEVAVGFGRTGKMFAVDHAKISPDIMCVGKALTGGMCGLAGTIVQDFIYDSFLSDNVFDAFMHGPTYMANPLACSASVASLDLFDIEHRLDNVKIIENIFEKHLKKFNNIDFIKDTRYIGAVGVIEIDKDWNYIFKLREKLLLKSIYLRPINNAIYITPALNITEDDLLLIIDQLYFILQE